MSQATNHITISAVVSRPTYDHDRHSLGPSTTKYPKCRSTRAAHQLATAQPIPTCGDSIELPGAGLPVEPFFTPCHTGMIAVP
jgi:hypothetical protein